MSKYTPVCVGSFLRAITLLLCVAVFALSSTAQTAGTGALSGTIKDSPGAVIPKATATATSVDTSQSRSATSDMDGIYKINLLPPGNYRVKFEATGFTVVEVPS